ncbi:type VI secretion system baseplate subunit TssF [Noviherbaspirillum sp.]|jgi:type VI secretion system protein ImpG|uniref:type VI secretion system baseplate subunit TssF n=1 Tax=Noviherbaspirillum sp. TaxID=1926288 RepID=UPI0025E6D82A|nr:type VI secretion system baseplate subunit TssF [Noviherbaspirillum sp.]
MDTLLPYYERELTFLRRQSSDFARRYPKVAGRLLLSGETCEDPHIERLIESFAFLAGRIHKKLDDEYPEFTDSLLQVVFPQYLKPFPSASIAHFDSGSGAAQLAKAARIPRSTLLNTRPVRGVPCRFTTTYDVDIWPIKVVNAAYENIFDVTGLPVNIARSISSVIRLDLAVSSDNVGFDALRANKLRFYLNGEPAVVALVREALFSKALGLWVTSPTMPEKVELPASAILPVGFADDEALLEEDPRSHRAHQLMLEYFVFPEKFNFFDLDLVALNEKLPLHTRTLEIRIGLAGVADRSSSANLLDRITKDNFVLGCTPVVNLFRQIPEPIRVSGTETTYPVIVDSRRPAAYEVYDIRHVFQVRQSVDGEEVCEFLPFYSIRHGQPHDGPVRYWHASYEDDGASSSYSMALSLIDSTMDLQRPATNTLSLDLTCTNRDLPSQLPFGLLEGDLFAEGGTIAKTIRMLRKPTPSYRFPKGRGAQWRLISHLSLNHLSLSGQGVDAIKEILTLYDIAGSVANNKQINGIAAIDQQPVTARIPGNPFPVFARGMQIRITLDETHYAGIGLFTFAQILDHFFGHYVHANSFTQLVLISKQSGQELLTCPVRNGASILA